MTEAKTKAQLGLKLSLVSLVSSHENGKKVLTQQHSDDLQWPKQQKKGHKHPGPFRQGLKGNDVVMT